MPCLNEERTIADCIESIKRVSLEKNIPIEIIVADNGSSDKSKEIALSCGAKVLHVPTRGYGAAIDAGIRAASTKWVVVGDSDMSYDFGDSVKLVEFGEENGCQLVVGNRFKGGISKGAMPMLHKYLGNPLLSYVARTFFGIPIGDFHCGLRAIDRSAYLEVNPRSRGMEYATEMILKFSDKKYVIGEVPTTLKPDGRDRKPHLRSFPDGWRHLKLMMLYAPQFTLLFPGILLAALGSLSLAFYAFRGEISIFNFRGDVTASILMGLIALLGAQLFVAGAASIANAKARGIGNFRWVTPRYSHVRNKIVLGVPIGLIILSGAMLCRFTIGWVMSGEMHLDPTKSTRMTIPGVFAFLIGTQLLLGAIQVRQILSEFWE